MKVLNMAFDDPLDIDVGNGMDYFHYHSICDRGIEVKEMGPFKYPPARSEHLIARMQFLMNRDIEWIIIPLPCKFALNIYVDTTLNQRVDQLGLWQLTTGEPVIYHMGNLLDEKALPEIKSMGSAEILNQPPVAPRAPYTSSTDSAKLRAFKFVSGLECWTAFINLTRQLYNLLFEYFAQKNDQAHFHYC